MKLIARKYVVVTRPAWASCRVKSIRHTRLRYNNDSATTRIQAYMTITAIPKFVAFCLWRNLKCSRITREFSITYARLQTLPWKSESRHVKAVVTASVNQNSKRRSSTVPYFRTAALSRRKVILQNLYILTICLNSRLFDNVFRL